MVLPMARVCRALWLVLPLVRKRLQVFRGMTVALVVTTTTTIATRSQKIPVIMRNGGASTPKRMKTMCSTLSSVSLKTKHAYADFNYKKRFVQNMAGNMGMGCGFTC